MKLFLLSLLIGYILLPSLVYGQSCNYDRHMFLSESMAKAANDWDYRANVCEEYGFHEIAELYRELSLRHEAHGRTCKNSPYLSEQTLANLNKAKNDLDMFQLDRNVKFRTEFCSFTDYLVITLDTE